MKPTENPALCKRNAIRSRKLTNWLNTMLFVVASCLFRLLNSSISASIFEDDRHLSRSSRPRIPCRVFVFSSKSKAGASRSIVKGTWQIGHAGWCKGHWYSARQQAIKKPRTFASIAVFKYCLIHSRSKMCRHFAWMASSAMSLHIRQTVASPRSSCKNDPALVLLRRTRSGWQAIWRILVKRLKMLE